MKQKNKSSLKLMSNFSTAITKEAKDALDMFCKKRGIKINHFLEEIIWDRLEEEMDLEIAANTDYSNLIDMKKITRVVK